MKILIADDERMSLHLLESTLGAWGHEVVSVSDGLEAWEVLQQEDAPQLAILDWVMPGLDGLELCRRVRETPATQSLHLILITAKRDQNDIVQGLAAGANDYLIKPYDRAELSARLLTAGRMIEMQSAMTAELAERRRTEEILSTQEQRFRSLIENSSDAIALFNVDGTIIYASPSTPQVLGFTQDEFVHLNALDIIHPDDRKVVVACLKEALKLPRVGFGVESRVRHKDGSWRWLEGTFTNLLEEPSVRAFVNNYRDITQRKGAQQALRESEEQLRLSQKLEAVGQLAGGIAHDFNNLLVVINGYSELLLRHNTTDESSRQKIEEIKKAGERAASLTHQLLAFSRKQVMQPVTLDLNVTVNNIGKMLQRVIGEDIEVVLALKPALGNVKADPGQIEQLLMNLVVNARDAMPHGGKLVIETTNVDLTAEYAGRHVAVQPGPHVRLAVTDNGQGMDPETQKHIFEPFFTSKEVGKGTGLGLSTVYGIVKQSGGNIWVYSESGMGTSFKIYLPRTNEEIDQPRLEARQAPLPQGNETILVVEDEPMVRDITRTTLEMNGYTVYEAANGREALTFTESHHEKIDLVLTDVVMPLMSGKNLAQQLASLRPQTKMLYMSGYTDDALLHHGVLDEGIAFLEKPFTPMGLMCKVREVLDA